MARKLYLLLVLGLWNIIVFAQEIDIILIGGQSNATGQGYVCNIPQSFKLDSSAYIYYSKHLNKGIESEIWRPLCPASETSDKFGVELSLGTSLVKKYPNKKIGIIKHALSGSNLYAQWNPGNRMDEVQGEEYQKFIFTVRKGLQDMNDKGFTPIIRAMVWQQGEADARYDAGMINSEKYAANLKNFILQIRKEFNRPDMQFIFGKVMPLEAERFTGRKTVRAGQVSVDENSKSDYAVKGAKLVECDDLEMRRHDYQTPYPYDDVHLGTYGILMLGERFAKIIKLD